MFNKKLMRNFLYSTLFLIYSFNPLISQGIRNYGVQSDLRLVDLYEKIKNRVGKESSSIEKIKGSPYFNKNFKLANVEYFGKLLKDTLYLRFNAFSDEMEIASDPKINSSENILIKNNKVFCIIEGEKYRYLGFIANNQPPSIGYVKELFIGMIFSFYERKTKIFMGATVAKTSLERSFPARFVDKIEYYFSINNSELNQIKLSKKKILSKLKPYTILIKKFLEESQAKLKTREEVVALFKFLDLTQSQLQKNFK